MTPEQRKKLEEKAKEAFRKGIGFEGTATFFDGHRLGAQAAWEMATKAERERIASRIQVLSGGPRADILAEIFNPPAESEAG